MIKRTSEMGKADKNIFERDKSGEIIQLDNSPFYTDFAGIYAGWRIGKRQRFKFKIKET